MDQIDPSTCVQQDAPTTPPAPGKTRRRQEERSAATRRVILDAAVAVIAEVGIGAGVRPIAQRAGVSRGALQHHFPSRDDLLAAVIGEEINADLNRRLDVAAIASLPLRRRVEELLAHYYRVYRSPVFNAVLSAAAGATPVLAGEIEEVLTRSQEMINRTWRDVFDDIPIADEDLSALRRVTMSALRGYAVRQRLGEQGSWQTDMGALTRMLITQLVAP